MPVADDLARANGERQLMERAWPTISLADLRLSSVMDSSGREQVVADGLSFKRRNKKKPSAGAASGSVAALRPKNANTAGTLRFEDVEKLGFGCRRPRR